jgi:hypothetical protein
MHGAECMEMPDLRGGRADARGRARGTLMDVAPVPI